EASNGAGNAASPELRITGPLNANLPTVAAFADVTYLRGKLGVGEPAPAAEVQVHVRGARLRLQSADSARSIDLRTDGSAVDLQTTTSHLYLRSSTPAGPPSRHIVMNPYPEDGNVGVGTAAPVQKLHVAGPFIRVDGAGQEQAYLGGDGSLTVYGGWPFPAPDVQIGSFNPAVHAVHCWNAGANRWMDLICDNAYELSDETAKTDIRPLGGGLERLRKMRGVSYRMKGDPGSRLRVGVVAQEVATVLPEAVTQSSRGAAVAYSTFVPVLIEAVKELAAQVDALRAQVDALKGERHAAAPAPAPAQAEAPATKAPRASGKKR
ncbi:MAG: tail fiber domain-containing protein, partial [Ramlibacter sp.]